MTRATLFLELRRSRALVLGMAVVTLAYGGIMGAMYPVLAENQALMDEYMKVLPKEFLLVFGMTGSLTDPGVFFTTYISSWLWPIVAAIVAIGIGTRVTAADSERGWVEQPLATPLRRTSLALASILDQGIGLLVVALTAVVGLLGVGLAVAAPFDAGRFLLAVPSLFVFGAAIAGATMLLAVLTLSRGRAAGIVAGVLIAMYLLNVVVQIQPDFEELGYLGVFHYLDTTGTMSAGTMPWGDLAVLTTVALVGWGLAVWRFRTRDLVV
jgi:beta-exotoxin I transport system permease protein